MGGVWCLVYLGLWILLHTSMEISTCPADSSRFDSLSWLTLAALLTTMVDAAK